MHITITGDLGSGKSTVAKELCRILGFTYLSTGQIQRNLAQEMGMDTLEFNHFTDQNLHIDDYIDNKVKEINNKKEPHVLDSRLAWHFVQSSFKIYLMALDEVAALRVLKDDTRIGEPASSDVSQKIKELRERRESENQRFASNYGIKPALFQDFDAVVDTSTAGIEEVTQLLIKLYKQFVAKEALTKIWLSPIRILPVMNHNFPVFEKPSENKDWFLQEPVDCVLYKREFYVYKGLPALMAGLSAQMPFIPVRLVGREGNPEIPVEEFIKEGFDERDLKMMEDKFQIRYIRQQVM
jgi:cytidylate kinase